MVSQSTWEGAICANRWHCYSSNLLINFWAIGRYLYIILMSGCYFKKGLFIHFRVCAVFFIFCQRKTDLRFKLIPRRGIWHCGVINHIQVNLWILFEFMGLNVFEFMGLNVNSNLLRLIRDLGMWGDGYLCPTTYSPHCQHQNDSALRRAAAWDTLMSH